MEAKTLYSNTETRLTAVAVLPVEITYPAPSSTDADGDASSEPQLTREVDRASWREAALFLSPREALRALLFVGDDRGVLRSLRLTIECAGGQRGGLDTHMCAVESHRTVTLIPASVTSSAPLPSGTASEAATTRTAVGSASSSSEVSFLSVAPSAPFLIVGVVGGALCALSALRFDLVRDDAFWRACTSVVRTVCSPSSSTAPLIRTACEAMHQETQGEHGASASPAHRVCVATIENAVLLLSFTSERVACLGSLTPPGTVHALAWVRSTLVAVCGDSAVLYTYDAVSLHLRHQTRPNTLPGVLPSPQPTLPSLARHARLHYLAPTHETHVRSEVQNISAETPTVLCWDPAILVARAGRTAGQCRLCYVEARGRGTLPSVAGDGSTDMVASALSDPSHELPCPSSVTDLTCLSPFLIGETNAGLVLQSVWDGGAWLSGPRNTTAFEAKGTRGLVAMPMGALVLADHAIEAHILSPMSVQVDLLVQSQHYAKAEWFMETMMRSAVRRGASRQEDVDAALGRLYPVMAAHAWGQQAYRPAFDYFQKAGTPPRTLLALFPELRLPQLKSREGAALTSTTERNPALSVHFTTCPLAEPYERLYRQLKATLMAWEAADDDDDEDGDRGDAQEQDQNPDALREDVEYALFLLLALLPGEKQITAPVSLSSSASVLLLCRTLPLIWCLAVLAASTKAPSFSPADHPLVPFLYAACGELTTALDVCRATSAVQSAGLVLRSTPDCTDTLYTTHLPWMLEANATLTGSIVVAPHVCAPSVPTIVALLAGSASTSEILLQYLHYCVYDETSPAQLGRAEEKKAVQTAYALHLIELIHDMHVSLGLEGIEAAANVCLRVPAGSEAGFLGVCRRLLLTFLDRTADVCYDEISVMARLHTTGLFAEKAKVQEHVRDHVGVLETLAYDLDDVNSAVRYCLEKSVADASTTVALATSPVVAPSGEHTPATAQAEWDADTSPHETKATPASDSTPPHSKPLLLMLLHLLLVPPRKATEPRMADALHLLATHAPFLNPLAVLDILPGELPLSDVEPYLLRTFQTMALETELVELEAAATMSALETARRSHVRLEQRCAWVMESRPCAVCHQQMARSTAQWVFPDLKVAHFHCVHNAHAEPERQTPYRVVPNLPV